MTPISAELCPRFPADLTSRKLNGGAMADLNGNLLEQVQMLVNQYGYDVVKEALVTVRGPGRTELANGRLYLVWGVVELVKTVKKCKTDEAFLEITGAGG